MNSRKILKAPTLFFVSYVLLSQVILTGAESGESGYANGYVFNDLNKNGIKDPDEKGISHVAVSNGEEVVLTDKEGSYRLAVDQDTPLFFIKPAEWDLPLNELNLPQFYYLHKPEGSPQDLKYPGVQPTGALPASVDFPLHQSSAETSFRVLLFGDPQPKSLAEIDFFERDIISELIDVENVAFGITLGDIVSDNLDHFTPVNTAVAKVGIPFFNVYGNHDMNFDVKEDRYADESFERIYGPPTYAFRHGDALFIILDNVIYPSKQSYYIGGFTEKQLSFVENLLGTVSKDTLIVLSMHIPLFEQPDFGRTFRTEDRDQLFALLADFPNTLSLSAHTHSQRHHFFDEAKQWKQAEPHHHYNVGTTSGAWWSGPLDHRGIPNRTMHDGTPSGYAFLNIEGNNYTYDYKVANASAGEQMRLYVPKVVRLSDYRSPVIANVYNATSKAKVQFRVIDHNKRWRKMELFETVDPYAMQLVLDRDTSEAPPPGPRLGYPSHSKHLWRAFLPKDLSPGEHTLEVRTTDIFGRIFTEEASFMVE